MTPRTIAGRYALEEALGDSTWRATDTELGRQVLVRLGPAAETVSAALEHPGIARVFDQGESDGERYAVLEYLPGGTLAERLAELDEDQAHGVAAELATALAYAHAQGATHGSLTAASVLFDGEGRAKLDGFGADGTPEADVRAFGSILQALARTAPALGAAAAAALTGEVDAAELAERIRGAEPEPAVEEQTAVLVPPPRVAPGRRRTVVIAAAAVVALLLAGIGAALLATGDSTTADVTTGSTSAATSTGSTEATTAESEPPPATSAPTTESTAPATTETEPEPEPEPTTAPTTTAPPPTTEPPPPPPPPTEPPTTEEPPPTTEPPPTITQPLG